MIALEGACNQLEAAMDRMQVVRWGCSIDDKSRRIAEECFDPQTPKGGMSHS